jgi:hypothetical protein
MDSTSNGTSDRRTAADESVADGRVPTSAIESDYVYRSIDHRRRRYVVATLAVEGSTTVSELATRIREREGDRDSDRDRDGNGRDAAAGTGTVVGASDGRDDERGSRAPSEDVRLSLAHTHLPKLEEQGVVRHDRATGRVEPTDRTAVVAAAMRGVGTLVEDA